MKLRFELSGLLLAAFLLIAAPVTVHGKVETKQTKNEVLIKTPRPTEERTPEPTRKPTDKPTKAPETPKPTDEPTKAPETPKPTDEKTPEPTPRPTEEDTPEPTRQTKVPAPTAAPTTKVPAPTAAPTTKVPAPTISPTTKEPAPTSFPTRKPTAGTKPPSQAPNVSPTPVPTRTPKPVKTESPTDSPSPQPTPKPTKTADPTPISTMVPTQEGTIVETVADTSVLTGSPTDGTPVPTPAPTTSPTKRPPVAALTFPPTPRPTTGEPTSTSSPSAGAKPSATPAPTPTKEVKPGNKPKPTDEPTKSPTPVLSTSPVEELILDVQKVSSSDDFVVDFSLWSQHKTSDLEKMKAAVLHSVRVLYCQERYYLQGDVVEEEYDEDICIVKNNFLSPKLTQESIKQLNEEGSAASKNKTLQDTLLLPSIQDVRFSEANDIPWTTWKVEFRVKQLGLPFIRGVVEELEGETNLKAQEVHRLASQMIHQKISFDLDKSIRKGTFDVLLQNEMKDTSIATSVLGEETTVFSEEMIESAISNPNGDMSSEEDSQNKTSLIVIGAGAVVAILASAVLVACYIKYKASPGKKKSQESTSIEVGSGEGDEQNGESKESATPIEVSSNRMLNDEEMSKLSSDRSSTQQDEDGEELLDVASWQVKPRRFELAAPSEAGRSTGYGESVDDDATLPKAGSIVAGSIMTDSMLGASNPESSVSGWSDNSGGMGVDLQWA